MSRIRLSLAVIAILLLSSLSGSAAYAQCVGHIKLTVDNKSYSAHDVGQVPQYRVEGECLMSLSVSTRYRVLSPPVKNTCNLDLSGAWNDWASLPQPDDNHQINWKSAPIPLRECQREGVFQVEVNASDLNSLPVFSSVVVAVKSTFPTTLDLLESPILKGSVGTFVVNDNGAAENGDYFSQLRVPNDSNTPYTVQLALDALFDKRVSEGLPVPEPELITEGLMKAFAGTGSLTSLLTRAKQLFVANKKQPVLLFYDDASKWSGTFQMVPATGTLQAAYFIVRRVVPDKDARSNRVLTFAASVPADKDKTLDELETENLQRLRRKDRKGHIAAGTIEMREEDATTPVPESTFPMPAIPRVSTPKNR